MAIIALTSTAQAGYRIVIPMKQSKGRPLPNGSISITPKTPSLPVENWQPAEPLYSEWVNVGNVSGCSNWTPDASTMLKDETFNQTAKDCIQYQTRTRQNREQETTTLAYRNVGEPVTIEQNVTASSSRTATGTASCSFIESGTNTTFWARIENGSRGQGVTVNGVQIKMVFGYSIENTFTINGVKYTRGETKLSYSEGTSYSAVCKQI
ncbi:hypothetical protein [Pseudomonas helleri]|uniref:hypothetical protein n=1 Tax=Pseudomonas helleri TaxID=1608996 RepID=UPI003F97FB52